MASSAAIMLPGLPLLSQLLTASSLNSRIKSRRVLLGLAWGTSGFFRDGFDCDFLVNPLSVNPKKPYNFKCDRIWVVEASLVC